MCTSVNNQPMSIIWNWAGYGAFLFRHWHSQPFNGRPLGNSYLSVGHQFEFPTNPFHTDPLQNGSTGSQLPESGLFNRESDKPVTVSRDWWSSQCLYPGVREVRSGPLTSLPLASFSIQICLPECGLTPKNCSNCEVRQHYLTVSTTLLILEGCGPSTTNRAHSFALISI